MSGPAFVLVDANRADIFSLLGRGRGLFRVARDSESARTHRALKDVRGLGWVEDRVGNSAFALTWLGPGSIFDPNAVGEQAKDVRDRHFLAKRTTIPEHGRRLHAAIRRLRLGKHAERLVWAIHQQVIETQTSAVRLPDYLLRTAVWGEISPELLPHWRSELLTVLESLTWLHVADGSKQDRSRFGTKTVFLSDVKDLRKTADDECGPDCPGHGGLRHHHYRITIGRGFLGALEQVVESCDDKGVRRYSFRPSETKGTTALRKIGKTGRLVTVFLPAKLGAPVVCQMLSSGAHRLLQALVRETTRNTKRRRRDLSEAEVTTGNEIPDIAGKGTIACNLLDAQGKYVGFNGNKKRKGMGYRLTTPGGWLAKAGYGVSEVEAFLADLETLSVHLGITVVGLLPGSQELLDLASLSRLANTQMGRRTLDKVHVRVYAAADYASRWAEFFRWSGVSPGRPDDKTEAVSVLLATMKRKKITQRALALGIGEDSSFLSRLFRGKKPWPKGMFEKARKWVDSYKPPQRPHVRITGLISAMEK